MKWTTKVEVSNEVFCVNWELSVPCMAIAIPDMAAMMAGTDKSLSKILTS